MNDLNTKQKIDILCNSSNFNNSEELQKIITFYDLSYSQNSNGIFLNVSILTDEIINAIYTLFCMQNNNIFSIDNIDELLYVPHDETTINNAKFTNINNTNNTNINTNVIKVNTRFNKLDSLILKTLKDYLNLI